MKNEKITAIDGREFWISRSIAVTICVVTKESRKFLVSQRGKNCPDHIGKWQITCGYLDWDETTKEGAVRELYEETGLKVNIEDLKLFEIVDDPKKDARQNVIFRYIVEVDEDFLSNFNINEDTASRGGEDNEVSKIELIDESNIDEKCWAFNHELVLKNILTILKK